ncbi:hypothetical protein chiPu_0022315 [Chiloscyllium punctatum]|uniref:Uncharacterized protein n=1 Tax=Chiloscyllium punctatum TaxID=137246 RepID=A0A401RHZ3_CHIPU|nr:hypothetical protein [Chiloscyllium punctatum]
MATSVDPEPVGAFRLSTKDGRRGGEARPPVSPPLGSGLTGCLSNRLPGSTDRQAARPTGLWGVRIGAASPFDGRWVRPMGNGDRLSARPAHPPA